MRHKKRYPRPERVGRSLCLIVACMSLVGVSCSRPGLVRDKYSADFYQIPKKLESNHFDQNPRFIIYGDNRPGWRLKEKFLRKEAWKTWKQLIVPFYQIYWLGNGVVGLVNGLRRVPDYGDEQARWVRDAVYERAKSSNVDFLINTGDLVTNGRHPQRWETFIKQYKEEVPVVTDFAYLPTVGNHEHANDSVYAMPNYRDVLSYPPFYTLHGPDIDVFVIDSNLILDQYGYIDDDTQDALFETWFVSDPDAGEVAWLAQGLRSSKKTFKAVVMHHPPLAFARHHGNWASAKNGRDLALKRHQLMELFRREGVDVVFSGHQHMYEHNTLSYTGESGEDDDIHFVITGGGGAPLHRAYDREEIDACRVNYTDEGLNTICVRQEVIYNYCLVDVTPSKMTIKVYRVSDDPDTNGRLVDTLILEGRGADSR
ncbi:MAG: metallophosphoesterase [Candidatus Krumholzibacteria bacterium]|nr:metallophosphoesterase [Candidatus Krumholzibacteria bacterium]